MKLINFFLKIHFFSVILKPPCTAITGIAPKTALVFVKFHVV